QDPLVRVASGSAFVVNRRGSARGRRAPTEPWLSARPAPPLEALDSTTPPEVRWIVPREVPRCGPCRRRAAGQEPVPDTLSLCSTENELLLRLVPRPPGGSHAHEDARTASMADMGSRQRASP